MISFLNFSPAVRRALRVDIAVGLLMTASIGLTNPFTGLILRRDLGASAFQLSVLASATAACLLLSLGLARLIDTRRPLPWVVWSTFAARGLFLLVPFIDGPWSFVALLVGVNLLGTATNLAQPALVQQVYPREERGRALGTVRLVGAVLAIGLALAAGHLLGAFSYRAVFCVAAVLGMAASLRQRALPVPAVATTETAEHTRLRDAWLAVRNDHGFRGVLLGSFVFGSGVWVMMPATPILLVDVLGASTAQVGMLAAVGAAAALGGSIVWGRLVDRRSALRALRAVYVVGALTPIIYYAARAPWMLVAASITESLMATGLDFVWMLVMIDAGGPRRTAQYTAIAATLAGVRGIIGPMVGGALIGTVGVHAVYLVAAALMMSGAILVSRQLRRSGQAVPAKAIARPSYAG